MILCLTPADFRVSYLQGFLDKGLGEGVHAGVMGADTRPRPQQGWPEGDAGSADFFDFTNASFWNQSAGQHQ